MKKILVILTILLLVGGGVGYAVYSGKNKIPNDRYGSFETMDAKTSDLEIYVNSYNQFNQLLRDMDVTYALMRVTDGNAERYNLASDYVEKYIETQEEIYAYNAKVPIPKEFKKLHETLIEEIGYTDLISDEFKEAISNDDFSKVDELIELKSQARTKGLDSTELIKYSKSDDEYYLND